MSSPETVRDTRESIQRNAAAMNRDLRTLELWKSAEAQGIDSSEGGSFGLDTRMFTDVKRREWHLYRERFVTSDETGASHLKLFNYFRYPCGVIVELDPMLEAACP